MVLCASSAVMPALKQALTRLMLPFYPIKKRPLLNTCIAFPLMMTHVRACVPLRCRGYFTKNKRIPCSSILVLKRTRTHQKRRKNNCAQWETARLQLSLSSATIRTKLHFLWVWTALPIPARLPPQHERNVSIIHEWSWSAHKRFFFVPRKVLISFRSDLFVTQFRHPSPVTAEVIIGSKTEYKPPPTMMKLM